MKVPRPVFVRFDPASAESGEELWIRRDAVDSIREVTAIETEMKLPLTEIGLRNGQTWWVKGTTSDVGRTFFGDDRGMTAARLLERACNTFILLCLIVSGWLVVTM